MNLIKFLDKKIWILYILAFIMISLTAFSGYYNDENQFSSIGYFMSKGLTPFIDFNEHHNLFYMYFYLPIFLLFHGATIQVAIRVLSIIFVIISAFLVYKLVKKHKLGNPHFAALFFLFGYTGLPINFLRNEFFAVVVLLLYFYVKNPILKGALVALLGSISIMFILPALALLLHLIIQFRKSFFSILLGSLSTGIAFIAYLLPITFSKLYYHLITINILIGKEFVTSVREMFFFSFFFALPYFLFGIYGLIRNIKKKIAVDSIIMLFTFFGIIVIMSLITGGISKAKLPSYLTMLGILSLFVGGIPNRVFYSTIALFFLLSLAIFTPDLYAINSLRDTYILSSCVKEDARVGFSSFEGDHLILLRLHATYDWFLGEHLARAGVESDRYEFSNPLSVCGVIFEKKENICSQEQINALNTRCLYRNKSNLMYAIRDYFFTYFGLNLKLS